MWAIHNSTPYRANRAWVRDSTGREVWLVAVRARFDIRSTGLTLAAPEDQSDVNIAPQVIGEGISSFITADSDLPHQKLTTDVLVDGSAHAPEGYLAERLSVRLRVRNIDKEIVVFGDRVWHSGKPGEAKPFSAMPLTYLRAFGGRDLSEPAHDVRSWYEANPVGVGFSSKVSALDGQSVPNIEHPIRLIRTAYERPVPAGFGPLMGHWPARRRYGGTYDRSWLEERMPLLPSDFDPRFHQCAPQDQQTSEFLSGGEEVSIEGAHPGGALRFELPRVSLVFESVFDDLTKVRHSAVLHTVVIEPDRPSVSMVWHTHLECHYRVYLLRETRIWERKRLRAQRQESLST